ncbi:unnamed protein product [Angiostrongylus costaricensis]|uniref:Cyclin_C domain-containing protein n=1 Tax=Angiostrongylus costaricensis TaxID=334426 RepID=A0A158PM55_ANGCS|nr:unnamed protein product [Angiostrongylus costaricensis]
MPMFTFSSPKNSSLDSCPIESYRELNGEPLEDNAYGIVLREGYATSSSRSSWESSGTAIEPMKSFSPSGPQNLDLSGSSFGNSPPPAYADTSPAPAKVYPRHEQDFSTQSSNERVSDFFSQSGSSSSDFSEESPPRNFHERCGRKGDLDDGPALFECAEYSFEAVTPVTRDRGGPQLALPRTYIWLSHQETAHAIGPLFMSAQKPSGASCEDRRLVLLKAASEMRKRKYTMEAFHLGAYILDKCLDSFHVSRDALADVCAVSMVLGTKMEEYDSLTPGTVNGLAGATKDKARLCDIEKRIVYEMTDGFCFSTPLDFANYMLEELNCTDEQIRHAHYLLDLALLDSRFRDEGGPRVAHAAVCISSAIITKRESSFESEFHALFEMERSLLELTKFPVGSTRDVMRGLMYEMKWVDNKRVCFCECSPALWDIICGDGTSFCERSELCMLMSKFTEIFQGGKEQADD